MKSPTFLALLCVLALPAQAQTTVAGFTPASFRVTESGSGEYRIPIRVPPGTAGIEPKLALVYNSQAGNGGAGMGWDLAGLSEVTRCPRTMAQDGARGGVYYDWNDRYCLDGQRLVPKSGSYAGYGGDGFEYRTERDSFTKVISYGTAGNGPARFKAWTKSGQIVEYGYTADSSIEAVGKASVRVWAVNRISDQKGNYLSVTYNENSGNGEFTVHRIDYGGNSVLGTPHPAYVRFQWDPRGDTSTSYVAGSPVGQTQILRKILGYSNTNNQDAYVKGYVLNTQLSALTARSVLTSVQECDNTDLNCLPPVTFGWQAGGSGWAAADAPMPVNWNPQYVWAGDFNGDGKMDLLSLQDSDAGFGQKRYVIFFSDGAGGWTSADGLMPRNWNPQRVWVGDFNADGKTDLVSLQDADAGYGLKRYVIFFSDGAGGWTAGDAQMERYWNPTYMWTGDFDGDGRVDLFGLQDSDPGYGHRRQVSFLSTGTGGWIAGDGAPPVAWNPQYVWTGDFDGDGKTDILSLQDADAGFGQKRYVIFFASGAIADGTMPRNWNPQRVWVGDFNGDGKADLVSLQDSDASFGQRRYVIFFADGAGGWTAADAPMPRNWNPQYAWAGDFNGDGKTDLVSLQDADAGMGYKRYVIFFSDGNGGWTAGDAEMSRNWNPQRVWADDFSGDGKADLVSLQDGDPGFGQKRYVAFHTNAPYPDLMTSATSSLGAVTTLAYKPLTDGAVYLKDTGAAYPIVDLQIPLNVVYSVASSDGIGGSVTAVQYYMGLKSNLHGRGSLGFKWQRAVTAQADLRHRTDFLQDWPHTGLPSRVRKVRHSDGATLTDTTNTYGCTNPATSGACSVAVGNRYFPFVSQSVEGRKDLNLAVLPTVTTTTQYNSYGDQTSIVVSASDNHTKTTTNTFAPPDEGNWLIGLLTRSTVQSTTSAGTLTRTSGFEYAAGLVVREAIEPDISALCLVQTYTYDGFGNRASATTRNCNGTSTGGLTEAAVPTGHPVFQPRTTSTAYAAGTQTAGGSLSWSAGQFPTTNTNALGHQETREHDPRFGGVTKLTGPNGLATTWTYDAFGRKASETRSDGTSTTWTYTTCVACPPQGKYFVTTTSSGAPTRTVYFDSLNREISSEVQGFDGTLVRKDTEYESMGRVLRVSKPYYAGASRVWTTYQYDILGRVTQAEEPSTTAGTTRTATEYSVPLPLATRVTLSNGANGGANMPGGVAQLRTTEKNSQGWITKVTDTQGNTVTYTYDPFGNSKTTDVSGVITTLTHDLRGRKINMIDPDMGTSWGYAYNALGELVWQYDAKNQTTTMAYDKLGRMINRTEPDLVSNWFYDTYQGGAACNKGIGKLCQVTASNNYGRTVAYDSQGRVASLTTTVDVAHTVSYTYDSSGRLSTTTYPTGFAAQNIYNARGYLWKVQRVNDPDTTVFWTANVLDAAGNVKNELLGNGLTTERTYDELFRMKTVQSGAMHNLAYNFDAVGNVVQRVDIYNSTVVTENFVYDALNRLLTASGPGLTTRSFNYNAIGNMTYKSDVGTYTYPAIGGPRPHAVSSVSNGGVPNSVTASYTYDGHGNLLSAAGTIYPSTNPAVAFSRTLTYTSFNMPATVDQMQGGVPHSYTYTYSAEHDRVRLVTVRPTQRITSIYLHPAGKGALLYEKEIRCPGTAPCQPTDAGVVTEHKHYVNGGSGAVGVFVTKSAYGLGEGPQMRYYHRDHLGSIALVTNPSGAELQRLAYEAFGERRSPNGTSQDRASPLIGLMTDRGFTAHEHLDEMNLIHMNGRIYDPALGRFMTADPLVQHADNLQSYNRYSYVLNSPLMYTDPSGYLSLKRVTRSILGGAAKVFSRLDPLNRLSGGKLLENKHFSLTRFAREGADVLASMSLTGYASPRQLAEFVREQPFQRDFDDVVMNNPVLYMAGQWIATAATSWICMGCGGAIWTMYYTSIATGSSSAAIRAGAITFAANYVGGELQTAHLPLPAHMVASGVVGGFSAELQGGDFKDGFVRSALTAGATRGIQDALAYRGPDGPVQQTASVSEAGATAIGAARAFGDGLSNVLNSPHQSWSDLMYLAHTVGATATNALSATRLDTVHIYYYRDFGARREEQP